MMKRLFQVTALLAAMAAAAMAQAPQPGQPAQPTQAEVEAFQKVNATTTPDDRIKEADTFYATYPNSMLASYVMEMAAEANQLKGDSARAIFYYEQALKLDPKNYNAMLMIAAETAQTTREFDLDKEEKLGRATKLVADALALIPGAVKPNDAVTDQQWADLKQSDTARGHTALGMIAVARKNFDEAAKEFQTAVDMGPQPDPVTQIRLGNALNEAKRPDEAISVLDKVIGMQGLPANLKDFAENEKKRSQQIKAAK